MKNKIAPALLICALVMLSFVGCAKKGGHGEFYNYDLAKYVKLGDYNSVKYVLGNPSVSAEDVENKIKDDLETYKLTTKKEKTTPIVNGDIAVIDYVGKKDGKAFDGGTAQNYSLEIGSNSFIAGFEAGLVGKVAGQQVDLNLTFPKTYHEKSLAGKDVVFEVTINKVYEIEYPKLTDELVSKISPEKTVAKYREYVYNTLLEELNANVEQDAINTYIDEVIKTCEIKKYPKKEVDNYKADLVLYYTDVARAQNLSLETFLSYNGMTMEAFETAMEQNAKSITEKEMVFLYIADKEGITLSEEEYQNGLKSEMEKNNYTSQESYLAEVGEDNLRGLLLINKAIEELSSRSIQ